MAEISEPPPELFESTPPGSPNTQLAFRTSKNELLRKVLGNPPDDVDAAEHNFVKMRVMARLQHLEAEKLKNAAAVEDALRLAAANAAAAAAIAASAVPAALPNQPDPNVVVPRVGGVSVVSGVTVPWTGGSRTRPRTAPRGPYAYRPQDVKGRGKTRQMLVSPVDKIFRLGVPMTEAKSHKSSVVSLFDWVGHIRRELEQRGMETVFFIRTGDDEETYLLERYGQAKIEKVKYHVERLEARADDYDRENLELSATFLLNSLELEMMRIIRARTVEGASGPEIFAAIINYHQSLHEKAVLDQLKLAQEPAENVDTFSNKIMKYAKHIEAIGTEEQIAKLPKRVIDLYQDTQSTVFNIEGYPFICAPPSS
jgi:hypothetical protein